MKRFILAALAALMIATPALADRSGACQVVGSEINPTEARATDDFIKLSDGTTGTTQTGEDIFVAPIELRLSDIRATVDVAAGANDTYAIYFVSDAVRVTGLTCGFGGASDVTCYSGMQSAVVPAGSRLTLAIDTGEGTGDPAAAASIEVSACIRANR
ncbi:MAG: hypothetical protein V3S01_13295 [Dehalococcoidia bacterium]